MIKIYYRLSDRKSREGYSKSPSFITNENCLLNFIKNFELTKDEQLTVIADNINDNTEQWLKNLNVNYTRTQLGGVRSFDFALKEALNWGGGDNDIVYFVENDYIHRKNSKAALTEALYDLKADYVSLYDCPDKYETHYNVNYNKRINVKESPEVFKSKIFFGKLSYWREASTSTLTFGTKLKTLQEDCHVFKHGCIERNHIKQQEKMSEYVSCPGCVCDDFKIFKTLTQAYDRLLITPMPGFASHGDLFSPSIDWKLEL